MAAGVPPCAGVGEAARRLAEIELGEGRLHLPPGGFADVAHEGLDG